jgi:hypothetical protein
MSETRPFIRYGSSTDWASDPLFTYDAEQAADGRVHLAASRSA